MSGEWKKVCASLGPTLSRDRNENEAVDRTFSASISLRVFHSQSFSIERLIQSVRQMFSIEAKISESLPKEDTPGTP